MPAALIPPGTTPVSRFAPSVTGVLHLGHVAHAIFVWGVTRALGGKIILRVEDHDRSRYRPEFESAILFDLDWLGFEPDIGSTAALRDERASLFRQSDRHATHAARLADLAAQNALYFCDCSRKDIQARTGQLEGELRYDGHCRNRGLSPGPGRTLRVKLPGESVTFNDLRHGPITQNPAEQCGDIVVRDRLGNWSYHFAVVADDYAQRVNLIIRGDDLIDSTGRQILLARMMGRPDVPFYYHHPLIMDDAGRKLSKRDAATGIAQARHEGASREAILGQAAFEVGLTDRVGDLDVSKIAELFKPFVCERP